MALVDRLRSPENRHLLIFIVSVVSVAMLASGLAISSTMSTEKARENASKERSTINSKLDVLLAGEALEVEQPGNVTVINPANITLIIPNVTAQSRAPFANETTTLASFSNVIIQ